MAKIDRRSQPKAQSLAARTQQVEIDLDYNINSIPLLYANKLTVSFTGNEFILYLIEAFPLPIPNPSIELPKSIKGRVIGRFAMSPREWMAGVEAFHEQITHLQQDDVIRVTKAEDPSEEGTNDRN